MRRSALVLAGALMLVGGPAYAEEFSVDSRCCGPLYYNISPGGHVTGNYPKQGGRISGDVGPGGTATGTWTQPRSDHPCIRPRRGSFAWGRFVIRNIGTSDISGEWGYCDEMPDHAEVS